MDCFQLVCVSWHLYLLKISNKDIELSHTLIEDVYDNYLDYLAAAEDTCSFNNGSNTFNEYFVETVRANLGNTCRIPAYRAVLTWNYS